VAARALTAMSLWALGEAGFHRLHLSHSTRNEASCRAAVTAGFLLEGTKRSDAVHADGRHDMHLRCLNVRRTATLRIRRRRSGGDVYYARLFLGLFFALRLLALEGCLNFFFFLRSIGWVTYAGIGCGAG